MGERESAASPEPDAGSADLSPRDIRILEFEREWWRHAGAKEEAIREVFGLSAARYYQLLNVVIDLPEAVRRDPMLVGRLQRLRDSRVESRSLRRFAGASASENDRSQSRTEPIE
jgi:hypothetical protein